MAAYHPIQVIAVTGGKGGVGKTNAAVNLGIQLSRMGQRVVLMDADLSLANVDIMLGLSPKENIEHVLAGQCSLVDTLVEGPEGLKVVPASSGTQSLTQLGAQQHAGLISAFSELANEMDVLIIDTAAGISDTVISFVQASQEVLMVVCNEPTSITDAYAMIKILSQQYGVSRFHVIANMVKNDQEGRQLYGKLINVVDRFLDASLKYSGCIPFDDHVRKAVQRQKAVSEAYPSSPAAQAYKKLAESVNQWPLPSAPRGHLEFFVDHLVASQQAVQPMS